MRKTISYCVTISSEETESKRLLPFLIENIREEDEICVLLDRPKCPPGLLDYLHKLTSNKEIILKEDIFLGHFGEWKNRLLTLASKNHIVQLDSDEMVTKEFIDDLPLILESNDIDVLGMVRRNKVEGITQDHINKWRWNIMKLEDEIEEKIFNMGKSEDVTKYNLLKHYNLIIEEQELYIKKVKYYIPLINYSDTQLRIFKRNGKISWKNNLHEVLTGHETMSILPEQYYIIHDKSISKQEKQNNYYDTL